MTIAEKLTTIAENEQRVYNAGYNAGKALNYDEGYEAGKQAEYDAFWDNYQNNGTRIGGYMLFAGQGWNSKNYKPKYKVIIGDEKYPRYSTSMFERFDNLQKYPALEINDGDIDFSRATALQYTFRNANVAKVEMDCVPPNLTKMTSTFTMNSISTFVLHTLKIGVTANTTFDDLCFRIPILKNISFIEGSVIGKTVNFSYTAVLTKESIVNIVNVLSSTATGKTLTLSLAAVNKAFETSEGANNGSTSQEWSTLTATKTNWTISLA